MRISLIMDVDKEILDVPLQMRNILETNLLEAFHAPLDKLCNIWSNLGIDDTQGHERMKVVISHLLGLLEVMVAEEEDLQNKLLKNIDNCKEKITELCNELDFTIPEYPTHSQILYLERDLQSQLCELSKVKEDRLKRLKYLKDVEKRLCSCLKMPSHNLTTSNVPSEKDLHELEQHVKMLQDEKHLRLTRFKSERKEISVIMETLELCPITTFEHEVVYDEVKEFILSNENMEAVKKLLEKVKNIQKEAEEEAGLLKDKLNTLWERLNIHHNERNQFLSLHSRITMTTLQALRDEVSRCQLLKMKNIKIFVEKIRDEIVDLWTKCYFGINERKNFEAFHDENYTEELLELHEQEAKKLRLFYAENEPIFSKIVKRENLWNALLQFEKCANDPNRLTNRGGALLQEERNRKKLMKELPKVEQELFELIDHWEEENKQPFLINGCNYKQHIEDQWNEHRQQKENEKLDRQKYKAQKFKEETGTTPTFTPAKRKMFTTTPSKTPSKLKRLDVVTPGFTHPSRSIRHSAGKRNRSPRYTPKRRTPVVKEVRRVLGEKNFKGKEVVKTNISPPTSVNVTSYVNFKALQNQKPDVFSSTAIPYPFVAVQPPTPDRTSSTERL